jgi:hypothetical protein
MMTFIQFSQRTSKVNCLNAPNVITQREFKEKEDKGFIVKAYKWENQANTKRTITTLALTGCL